jgi:hypothetical protein
MQQLMKSLSGKASDPKLKGLLEQSVAGIGKHTETLKSEMRARAARSEKNVAKAWKD